MAAITPDGSALQRDFDTFGYVGAHDNFSFFSATQYQVSQKDAFANDFEEIVQKMRDGKMTPIISELFRLSQAVEANETLVSGQGVMGKMEFVVDAELAKVHGL